MKDRLTVAKRLVFLCLWCYSECISTPDKLEKYTWPRWESNLRPLVIDISMVLAEKNLNKVRAFWHSTPLPTIIKHLTPLDEHKHWCVEQILSWRELLKACPNFQAM
jgi:hypothetical protein